MRKIKERWDAFCQRVEADPKHTDEIFSWLDRFYNEPGRHYHNWDHIENCLMQINEMENGPPGGCGPLGGLKIENYDELEYAVWFHDVIYSFGFQDNDEEASAKLACICAEKLGLTRNGRIDTFVVSSLIGLTEEHEPDIREYIGFKLAQHAMVDVDLSIFSWDEKKVDAYDEAIRNEYFWVPFGDFARGRTQALKKYYYRDKIYYSPWFEGRNQIAKRNIKRLIDKYGS